MQSYSLNTDIIKSFAENNSAALRRAFRLFLYIKTHFPNRHFLILSEVRDQILGSEAFTRFTLDKYLATLAASGWISTDSQGRIFLRGRKKFFAGTSKKTAVCVLVPGEVTEDHHTWTQFIAGAQVETVSRYVSRASSKQRRKYATSSESVGDATACTTRPLALVLLQQQLGVSRATASRLRQRGARGGFISNTIVKDPAPEVFAGCSRRQMLCMRSDMAAAGQRIEVDRIEYLTGLVERQTASANAIVWDGKRNQAVWQRPNLVGNTGLTFTRIKFLA